MLKSRLRRISLVLFLGAIVISAAVYADGEASTAALKACINNNVASAKKKKNPTAESIVVACQAEYDALVVKLPPGLQYEVKRDIKDQIRKKLK